MIEIPLEPQMRKLFEETEFFEGLRYPFNRQKQNEENIEDLLDGELYNNFADFFSDFGNISVSWNTDGIPIFKSSKFSVWPTLCPQPFGKLIFFHPSLSSDNLFLLY